MLIRTASVADAPVLAALFNHEFRQTLSTFRSDPRSAEEVAREISAKAAQDHLFLVAETERVVLGLATYGQFRANDGYRHIVEHSIVLAPAARGQGLGQQLMSALEAHATAAGHHSLIAGGSGANTAGVGFHLALGFRQVAVLPEVGLKQGRWLDLVVLQKQLQPG